jgi:ComF family protein
MNFDFLMNLIFPVACVSCTKNIPHGALCDECLASIVLRNASLESHDGYTLGAGTSYEIPAVQSLVRSLKFDHVRSAAVPLAQTLIAYARRLPIESTGAVVVPIPLSVRRFRERGFNQSVLIAKPFAESLAIPFVPGILTRPVHRKPQSETTSARERYENIRDCFAAHLPSAHLPRTIILVDDVATSGATFGEAVRTIRAANGGSNVEKIIALAVARA